MKGHFLLRRDVFSWCVYDWANSAYVTSIITVLLPVYFLALTPDGGGPVTVAVGGVELETNGDALWSYLTGFYMLAAGLAAPFLGAIADGSRSKKKFLAACVLGGSLLTCGLGLATAGRYQLCGLLFVGASFLWVCGNLFYDALMLELTDRADELDAISSAGYAVGYLGGGVLLSVNLAMVTWPEWFGLADAGAATRAAFVTVGVWWAVFSVPLLLWVPEPKGDGGASPARFRAVVEAPARLRATLRRLREHGQALRMLVAFVFYNTGIGTVIVIAVLFGKAELDLSSSTLIGCVLMIQLVGFPAAYGFIGLARYVGNRNAILIGLAIYVAVLIFAYSIKIENAERDFWILSMCIALVQGGTQALSRSLYGSMIPEGHSAEFFGFFSIFNKVGSFAGPITFGLARDITGSARVAILCLAVFFVIGAIVLLSVDARQD